MTRSGLHFRKISQVAEGMEIVGEKPRKRAEVVNSDNGPGTVGAC